MSNEIEVSYITCTSNSIKSLNDHKKSTHSISEALIFKTRKTLQHTYIRTVTPFPLSFALSTFINFCTHSRWFLVLFTFFQNINLVGKCLCNIVLISEYTFFMKNGNLHNFLYHYICGYRSN